MNLLKLKPGKLLKYLTPTMLVVVIVTGILIISGGNWASKAIQGPLMIAEYQEDYPQEQVCMGEAKNIMQKLAGLIDSANKPGGPYACMRENYLIILPTPCPPTSELVVGYVLGAKGTNPKSWVIAHGTGHDTLQFVPGNRCPFTAPWGCYEIVFEDSVTHKASECFIHNLPVI